MPQANYSEHRVGPFRICSGQMSNSPLYPHGSLRRLARPMLDQYVLLTGSPGKSLTHILRSPS